ncbi:class II aldolase/adducin family protein [Luminiphilus syltensis NOR5-1B]|uniref:Class II aldolase/adducin family protein n=2 Tax=Luminiphilus TaxID=1341118 RepID=B8KXI2_9GAMM|nr:class II aldolase/adducin family protein [Luminiphilus syltensis NOR5-1B]
MNASEADINAGGERSPKEERAFRKQRLAAALRIFARLGFDEGVAGHITVRDSIDTDTFWVNPMGRSFAQMRVSDLIRVDGQGEVVEGAGLLNAAAFTIHAHIHTARPDVMAAAHAHSVHGKAFSALGKLLDPLTQDACAFFEDHALLDDYTGVVVDQTEGDRLARMLGDKKAIILQNHGLLTVGHSVEEACWWFVAMERSCQAQLLADAAGHPRKIPDDRARHTAGQVGSHLAGWFSAQPMFDVIIAEHPGLLE